MRLLKRARIGASFIALMMVLSFVAPTSAFAGTLTSATFTTSGSGYAVTGAQNTTYNYGFTTATASTVSRVNATVPTGTQPNGSKFLALTSVNGNYASTPDSVSNSPVNTLDVKVKASLSNWSSTTEQDLMSKWDTPTSQRSFLFSMKPTPAPSLQFCWWDTTNSHCYVQPLGSNVPANGSTAWMRATLSTNGTNDFLTMYMSTDGTNWTVLLNTVPYGYNGPLFDSNEALQIGGHDGSTWVPNGRIYQASLATSINGTTTSPSTCSSTGVVDCFNANDWTSGTTLTSSSPQSETWTINRTGTGLPADIGSNLVVSNVTGLPAGGIGTFRLIDNFAAYVLPTATSVAASTPCVISFGGFTNTATAGSYASTIATYDNSATPAVVDSATTGTLIFAPVTSSASASATIDPTFTFTVLGYGGPCAGTNPTAGTTSSATTANLGHVTSSSPSNVEQGFGLTTNAGGGGVVYVRSDGALRDGNGHSIADVPGSNASPAAFPSAGTSAFGYTTTGFALWSALTTMNQPIQTLAAPTSGVGFCIAYQAQISSTTPAGNYATTVTYTAVPSF